MGCVLVKSVDDAQSPSPHPQFNPLLPPSATGVPVSSVVLDFVINQSVDPVVAYQSPLQRNSQQILADSLRWGAPLSLEKRESLQSVTYIVPHKTSNIRTERPPLVALGGRRGNIHALSMLVQLSWEAQTPNNLKENCRDWVLNCIGDRNWSSPKSASMMRQAVPKLFANLSPHLIDVLTHNREILQRREHPDSNRDVDGTTALSCTGGSDQQLFWESSTILVVVAHQAASRPTNKVAKDLRSPRKRMTQLHYLSNCWASLEDIFALDESDTSVFWSESWNRCRRRKKKGRRQVLDGGQQLYNLIYTHLLNTCRSGGVLRQVRPKRHSKKHRPLHGATLKAPSSSSPHKISTCPPEDRFSTVERWLRCGELKEQHAMRADCIGRCTAIATNHIGAQTMISRLSRTTKRTMQEPLVRVAGDDDVRSTTPREHNYSGSTKKTNNGTASFTSLNPLSCGPRKSTRSMDLLLEDHDGTKHIHRYVVPPLDRLHSLIESDPSLLKSPRGSSILLVKRSNQVLSQVVHYSHLDSLDKSRSMTSKEIPLLERSTLSSRSDNGEGQNVVQCTLENLQKYCSHRP